MMLAYLAALTFVTYTPSQLPGPPARCEAPTEQEQRRRFNQFIDKLLIEKKAEEAFNDAAVPDLKQHSPAFGSDRASTVKQFRWMFDHPQAKFVIEAVTLEGDLGSVRFNGVLAPSQPGALVTIFYRFRCGKIVETWDIFRLR